MTLVPFNLKRRAKGATFQSSELLPTEFGHWSNLEREPKSCFTILNLRGDKGNSVGRKFSYRLSDQDQETSTLTKREIRDSCPLK
jgi:hypothetical protein